MSHEGYRPHPEFSKKSKSKSVQSRWPLLPYSLYEVPVKKWYAYRVSFLDTPGWVLRETAVSESQGGVMWRRAWGGQVRAERLELIQATSVISWFMGPTGPSDTPSLVWDPQYPGGGASFCISMYTFLAEKKSQKMWGEKERGERNRETWDFPKLEKLTYSSQVSPVTRTGLSRHPSSSRSSSSPYILERSWESQLCSTVEGWLDRRQATGFLTQLCFWQAVYCGQVTGPLWGLVSSSVNGLALFPSFLPSSLPAPFLPSFPPFFSTYSLSTYLSERLWSRTPPSNSHNVLRILEYKRQQNKQTSKKDDYNAA